MGFEEWGALEALGVVFCDHGACYDALIGFVAIGEDVVFFVL